MPEACALDTATPPPGLIIDDSEDADARAPFLYDNIALISGCSTGKKMATAHSITPSAVSKWRAEGRIPLRYCMPYLPFVSYQRLAYGSVKGTIHEGRGYTRDPRLACFDPAKTGPILLVAQTNVYDVLHRIKLILGANDYGEVAEEFATTRNGVAAWIVREKIPDRTCLGFCRRYAVSLAWLLTGSGDVSIEGPGETS